MVGNPLQEMLMKTLIDRSNPVQATQELVALDSVTSASNTTISAFMQSRLEDLDFEVEQVEYVDLQGVPKIALATKRAPLSASQSGGGIGCFCHNDVVSVQGWDCPHGGPFDGAVQEGRLWGRGACDMKGPMAAALTALAGIDRREQRSSLYFFVTGDEECGMQGARLLPEKSAVFADMVASEAVGIITEPTDLQVVNAHKGGAHLNVTSRGIAAHSSTAEGKNANWQLIPFLAYVRDVAERCESDSALQNEAFSPKTLSLNLVIENEPSSSNITVGKAACRLFFRPMPETAWVMLLDEISDVAQRMDLHVDRLRPLPPLHTPADRPFVQTSLKLLGESDVHAVSYATDGCCFPQLQDLIVLGPGSIEQAHRPDEWIAVEQLHAGVQAYSKLFRHFACGN
jgi:acetylornithine deacetylase